MYGWILNPLRNLSFCTSQGSGGIWSSKCCFLLFQRQSRTIMKGQSDQLCSLSTVFLLAVPEAILSNNEGRSRSTVQCSVQCIIWFAPWRPRCSLVPYKSKEQNSCSVHSLCCSSLSQTQSYPKQKQGASVPPSPSIAGWGATMSIDFMWPLKLIKGL